LAGCIAKKKIGLFERKTRKKQGPPPIEMVWLRGRDKLDQRNARLLGREKKKE